MRSWWYVSCAMLMLLSMLAGCASAVVEESGPAAPRETVTLDAMPFANLVLGEANVVTIDAKSPSLVLDGNVERVAAFSLPTSSSPRYLTFVSKPYGGMMIYQLKTLVPVFTFLDSNRRPIATVASGPMDRKESFFKGNSFEGRVTVPTDARNVVVHGTKRTPGPLIVYGDPGHSATVPGSALGVLTLTLSDVGMAIVQDSGNREDSTKAQLFYLASIDGISIPNAAGESQRLSSGRGFQLATVFPSRFVPAKPSRVVVVGTHATGAPIHAIASKIAGTYRSVEAELEFTPEVGKTYVVKGNLDEDNPTVWIEDAVTGQPVTKKGTSNDRSSRK